jgi:hypothetical protein
MTDRFCGVKISRTTLCQYKQSMEIIKDKSSRDWLGVKSIRSEYWELDHMHKLAQIYDEVKYDLYSLLRLHKIVKDLGMNEHDIRNVLELAKYNQLQNLQREAQRIRSEINMVEAEKTEAMSQIFRLKRRIHESEETLTQKRAEAR